MTHEEAIKNLESIIDWMKGDERWTDAEFISIEMAIKALEQEPCPDVISRQAVNEIINDIRDYISVEDYWAFLERLKKLPPVHSQPNKEDIHREREQAYMCGFEDGSRKYRTEQSEDAISRSDMLDAIGHGTTYTSEELQKIIKGLPSVNPQPCEDAISREPFTDSTICEGIFCNECSFNRKDKGGCILEERVMKLPSIQPQPKTGHYMDYIFKNGKGY